MYPIVPPLTNPDLVDDVLTIIEEMAAVYGDRDVTLKDFIRDVKQAHSIYNYLLIRKQNFIK